MLKFGGMRVSDVILRPTKNQGAIRSRKKIVGAQCLYILDFLEGCATNASKPGTKWSKQFIGEFVCGNANFVLNFGPGALWGVVYGWSKIQHEARTPT